MPWGFYGNLIFAIIARKIFLIKWISTQLNIAILEKFTKERTFLHFLQWHVA